VAVALQIAAVVVVVEMELLLVMVQGLELVEPVVQVLLL
jgi:hypothetical protein